MSRQTATTGLAVLAIVLFSCGTALAHTHYGNSNVSVTPTEDVAPGDTVSVSFDYRIWHHHGGGSYPCPWEVRLDGTPGSRDGTLLASGVKYHPAYNQTITFHVATDVTIPDDASDGEHTIKIVTSADSQWYYYYNRYSSVTINVEADNTPPEIESISADPAELWPPNHKMVEVTVSATVRSC